MFESLIKSLLPPGFDMAEIIQTVTTLAQDFAEVKAGILRVETLLKSQAVPFTDTPITPPSVAALPATNPATVAVPAPAVQPENVTGSDSVLTLVPSPALVEQGDISPEVQAALVADVTTAPKVWGV